MTEDCQVHTGSDPMLTHFRVKNFIKKQRFFQFFLKVVKTLTLIIFPSIEKKLLGLQFYKTLFESKVQGDDPFKKKKKDFIFVQKDYLMYLTHKFSFKFHLFSSTHFFKLIYIKQILTFLAKDSFNFACSAFAASSSSSDPNKSISSSSSSSPPAAGALLEGPYDSTSFFFPAKLN
ncbi:hypothetical protein KUTeg_008941 [Tegillarca granosa]|uniref:Uncharacterized protein n=1 Tax=Tegillarca granosa TaxID=220873 RepID=A0ABQ9FDK7_TEGGR|nr:hypothetical protein KUTeg_008941 [Tegillarca granosa]